MAAIDLPFGWERAYRYGKAMAHLDLDAAGADELFNTALTHGLLAIAAATIKNHLSTRPGRQPSAADLLKDLVNAFGESEGVCMVPTGESAVLERMGLFGEGYEPPTEIAVNIRLLREALDLADAARHGRGPSGRLTAQHQAALEELDGHPALRSIGDAKRDRDWSDGVVADSYEFGRASNYIEFLTEEEVARRVEQAADSPAAPSYDDPTELQDCPVCGYLTLIPTGGDEMGYGITAGTCFVCSYSRSEDTAHELQMSAEMQRLADRD